MMYFQRCVRRDVPSAEAIFRIFSAEWPFQFTAAAAIAQSLTPGVLYNGTEADLDRCLCSRLRSPRDTDPHIFLV